MTKVTNSSYIPRVLRLNHIVFKRFKFPNYLFFESKASVQKSMHLRLNLSSKYFRLNGIIRNYGCRFFMWLMLVVHVSTFIILHIYACCLNCTHAVLIYVL